MKGNQQIIDKLNHLLTHELTAMDIYFLHSRIYDDYGLVKLFERINHEMEDETNHASQLIERILFLEGTPSLGNRLAYDGSTDVPTMIKTELDYEYAVCKELKSAIKLAEAEQDYGTREMLLGLLTDTESDHIDWLETQLGLIDKIGLERYLQTASEA